jgi:hypothetical protein
MTTPQPPYGSSPDDQPAQPPYGSAPGGPYGSASGSPYGSGSGAGGAPPPVTFEGQTFPGVPQQPVPAPSTGRRGLVVGAVALVTVGLAGTAVAAGALLSGGGTQPEDVLPSGALAFAKLDLDPAAGQKVALYRLAQEFPDVEVTGEDSIKDDLLASFFEGSEDIDYATQVEPWIGERVGVGAFPDGDDEGDEPDALAAFAYTDREAAEAALPDLVAGDGGFFAFSEAGDFVLIGDSQQAVDAAASGGSSLADDEGYGTAVGALEGDQIATAWADLEAVWAALPEEDKAAATESYGDALTPTGQVVLGVHADASFLEVTGQALGVSTGVDVAQLGASEGSGMLRQFPDDLLVGLSATGVGEALTSSFEDLRAAIGDETLDDLAAQLGLTLPDDLRVLLGDELALGVLDGEEPSFVARTRTSDPAAALAVAEKLSGLAGLPGSEPLPEEELAPDEEGPSAQECDELAAEGFAEDLGISPEDLAVICPGSGGAPAPAEEGRVAPLAAQEYEEGIAMGSSEQALARITTPGTLGSSEAFQQAVPDAASASVVLYADLAGLMGLLPFGDDGPDLGALRAVGMTAQGGEDGTFRLRVTVE